MSVDRPLDGLRILAIEQMQAMPFATQLLGDLGAEVVKVERLGGGDAGRQALPGVTDLDGDSVGTTFLRNNSNKRSVAIDLKNPQGVALLRALAKRFDVVAENLKPGTLDRLGLGYAQLSEDNPRLVYLSASGFGSLSPTPYRDRAAYAPIVEAMSSLYDFKRDPNVAPVVSPVGALGDTATALFAAVGLLAALRQRDETGRGAHVDVAMYDAMISMADVVPNNWSLGQMSGEPIAGVLSAFRATDGYFVVMASRDHHLQLLAKTVGHPEWLDHPQLRDREGWATHLEDIVRPGIETWAATRDREQAVQELCAAGLAAGPVNSATDLLADPHVADHGMIVELPRPLGGAPVLTVGNPIKFEGVPDRPRGRWPRVGEHTEEVLREELGIEGSELDDLVAVGAVARAKELNVDV